MRRSAAFASNHDFTRCYRSCHGSSLSRFLVINVPWSPGTSKSSYLVPHVPWWLDKLFSCHPGFICPILMGTLLPSFHGTKGSTKPGNMKPIVHMCLGSLTNILPVAISDRSLDHMVSWLPFSLIFGYQGPLVHRLPILAGTTDLKVSIYHGFLLKSAPRYLGEPIGNFCAIAWP